MNNKESPKNMLGDIKLPNKICCVSCHSCRGVRPDVLIARMARFKGTDKERFDALIASYTCRSCRKEKGVDGIGTVVLATSGTTGTVFDADSAFWRAPGYKICSDPKPLNNEQIINLTVTTCLLPNLILNKNCINCPYYQHCNLTDPRGNKRKFTEGTSEQNKKTKRLKN